MLGFMQLLVFVGVKLFVTIAGQTLTTPLVSGDTLNTTTVAAPITFEITYSVEAASTSSTSELPISVEDGSTSTPANESTSSAIHIEITEDNSTSTPANESTSALEVPISSVTPIETTEDNSTSTPANESTSALEVPISSVTPIETTDDNSTSSPANESTSAFEVPFSSVTPIPVIEDNSTSSPANESTSALEVPFSSVTPIPIIEDNSTSSPANESTSAVEVPFSSVTPIPIIEDNSTSSPANESTSELEVPISTVTPTPIIEDNSTSSPANESTSASEVPISSATPIQNTKDNSTSSPAVESTSTSVVDSTMLITTSVTSMTGNAAASTSTLPNTVESISHNTDFTSTPDVVSTSVAPATISTSQVPSTTSQVPSTTISEAISTTDASSSCECKNGVTCEQGECRCIAGYSGSQCETKVKRYLIQLKLQGKNLTSEPELRNKSTRAFKALERDICAYILLVLRSAASPLNATVVSCRVTHFTEGSVVGHTELRFAVATTDGAVVSRNTLNATLADGAKVVSDTPELIDKSPFTAAQAPPGAITVADVDECASADDNDCHGNAQCHNTDGGFTCKCLDGFEDRSNGSALDQRGRVCEADSASSDSASPSVPVYVYAIVTLCIMVGIAVFVALIIFWCTRGQKDEISDLEYCGTYDDVMSSEEYDIIQRINKAVEGANLDGFVLPRAVSVLSSPISTTTTTKMYDDVPNMVPTYGLSPDRYGFDQLKELY